MGKVIPIQQSKWTKILIKQNNFKNWTKLKLDHTGSTSYQIKNESWKSIHPVEKSKVTNIKNTVETTTSSVLTSVKKQLEWYYLIEKFENQSSI